MVNNNPGRVMAIDIGDRWLGVAISDPLRIIAAPHSCIKCEDDKEIIKEVCRLVETNEIALLVAGMPRSMNGSTGPQASKITQLVKKMARKVKVPVVFQDERLTTTQAQAIMANRKLKQGTRDDAFAAAIILQEYLNANVHSGNII